MIITLLALHLCAAPPTVSLEADSSVYNSVTREFALSGHVVLSRSAIDREDSTITLKADTMVGRVGGQVTAIGNVEVLYGPIDAFARQGTYDFSTATGRFDDISLVFDSWYIAAVSAKVSGPNHYEVEGVTATTCDEIPPHYDFRVGKAAFAGNRITLWNARMRLGRTTVLWLPWLAVTPGKPRPPFRISAGHGGYEGYFVKLAYLYDIGRLGDGYLKLDYYSRRGWGYGLVHQVAVPRGVLNFDLERIEERHRMAARGLARATYAQDLTPTLRLLGDAYYVTDGKFLQNYRFNQYVSRPDPVTTASITKRFSSSAWMLRLVDNLNRGDYEVTERTPEARFIMLPRPAPLKSYLELSGGVTGFRTDRPYDRDTALRISMDRRVQAPLYSFTRANASAKLSRPARLGAGWTLTPYLSVDALGYSERDSAAEFSGRVMPAYGGSLARFFYFHPGAHTRYTVRPVLDFQVRSMHGTPSWRTPDVEYIDQERDGKPLSLLLDQGLYRRHGGSWQERLRLRLDGGYDFDRYKGRQWLPVTAKVIALFGQGMRLNGDWIYDVENKGLKEARAEMTANYRRLQATGSYYFRKGIPGQDELENVGAEGSLDINRFWRARLGGSYNIMQHRLDYARYGLTRYLHDFIIGFEIVDQRVADAWDWRLTVELQAPNAHQNEVERESK